MQKEKNNFRVDLLEFLHGSEDLFRTGSLHCNSCKGKRKIHNVS